MSDTVFIDVNPDTWTQVSVGNTGYATNLSDQDVIYVEAAVTPLAALEIGHTLHPKESRTYNLEDGQEMYVRTSQTIFSIAITPGLGFGQLGPINTNVPVTILSSAARTATTISADIINFSAKGAHFIIDVIAFTGDPSIVVSIQGKDPVSGNYYDILVGTVFNIVDTFIMKVYPGLFDLHNLVSSDILPGTYRVVVTHGNTDSITYSVSALYVT